METVFMVMSIVLFISASYWQNYIKNHAFYYSRSSYYELTFTPSPSSSTTPPIQHVTLTTPMPHSLPFNPALSQHCNNNPLPCLPSPGLANKENRK